MNEREFKVSTRDERFRIAKMNAIEALAFQTGTSFDGVESTTKMFNEILDRIEVNVKDDKWLRVKDKNNYFPQGIEDDYLAIKEMVDYFLNSFLKPLFMKSSESK